MQIETIKTHVVTPQRISIKEQYKNDTICPSVFIRKFESKFFLIAIYVGDFHNIGTRENFQKKI